MIRRLNYILQASFSSSGCHFLLLNSQHLLRRLASLKFTYVFLMVTELKMKSLIGHLTRCPSKEQRV